MKWVLTLSIISFCYFILWKSSESIIGLQFNDPIIIQLFQNKWALQREGTHYFTYNKNFKRPSYDYSFKSTNNNNNDKDDETQWDVKHYNLNTLDNHPDSIKNNHKILILTPMDEFNLDYWENLRELDYPRENLELGIIIPRSINYQSLLNKIYDQVEILQTSHSSKPFRKITILLEDEINNQKFMTSLENEKQDPIDLEIVNRKLRATRKNELISTTLGPEISWILWLDGKICKTSTTLIQDLTNHGKPIITTNILTKKQYDPTKDHTEDKEDLFHPETLNNWVQSQISMNIINKLSYDDILIEGISSFDTDRPLMRQFYDPTQSPLTEMELDSVSSACTLIKSEIHRDGAMFPNFSFYNLIDSEGFTKMAKRLGYQAYGLPNYVVYMN